MNKIIVYLLFTIFMYQIGGYIVSFTILKISIESEMKLKINESLHDAEFVTFNFNTIVTHETFKWEKIDKEFWYKGTIYDIVKTDKSGTLKCIEDTKEKKLFKNLDFYVNGFFSKNPRGKKSLQTINSHFFAQFLPASGVLIPNRYFLDITLIFKNIISSNDNISLSILSPPPRFF